jgi:hypothetical protein
MTTSLFIKWYQECFVPEVVKFQMDKGKKLEAGHDLEHTDQELVAAYKNDP